MSRPRLTFFCELETPVLEALFRMFEPGELAGMEASLSLGLLDFSPERAEVVRRLNAAGVPVIAWLLLPKEKGYWFNLENHHHALSCYVDFQRWTQAEGLVWDGVGLDIEPDIREMSQLTGEWWQLIPGLAGRALNVRRFRRARHAYLELVGRIRDDGYRVETYQLPLIADDRKVCSTLFQRLAGVISLPADREVLMLYTNRIRPNGAGLIWSYGQDAQAIGLGSTGGGVDLELVDNSPLRWDELARDLRLAWIHTDDIYIFSLEGCIRQGFMERLKTFCWDVPIVDPTELAERVDRGRHAVQAGLWAGSHPLVLAGMAAGIVLFTKWMRRMLRTRSSYLVR